MAAKVKKEKVTKQKQFEDVDNNNRIANAKYFPIEKRKGNKKDVTDPDSGLDYVIRELDLILPDPSQVKKIEILTTNQSDGDYISVQIIDNDNGDLTGSAGSIADTPVRKRFLNSTMEEQRPVEIEYDREIPAGSILRINYFISGNQDAVLKANYDLKRKAK